MQASAVGLRQMLPSRVCQAVLPLHELPRLAFLAGALQRLPLVLTALYPHAPQHQAPVAAAAASGQPSGSGCTRSIGP